ncbi:aminotransferase class III-fold pyridoxal phosphate-dependent enzyme [Ulvibacter antarcticus]|uniref:Hydroxylysine kinase /5-phosphonooxy-L-lysine phospho-lyase n=1 Tax=Ulvibacter antarcticus TaxID=442714 RepID=A0A3L9Z0N7_9FLAO|nr:aminotransferase class III-fold pyridoxal phosphate-dependent enzyme [Ulvibacter antarcticus]RMA66413.1 hydroxylysine kinase /5-phosphonooxy-L-lysine phospho-lyase [Ulvibacter antarcticus]
MAIIISSEKASEIALLFFGITSEAFTLPGDTDENFKLKTAEGDYYLLKISPTDQDLNILEFQNELLKHLQSKKLDVQLPSVLPNMDGKYLSDYNSEDGTVRKIRLLNWIDGRLWAKVNPKTEMLRNNLGEQTGKITKALLDFEHPASKHTSQWNLAEVRWTRDFIQLFTAEERKLVGSFLDRFEDIQTTYKSLTKSVVYNDANDYNILVSEDLKNPKVTGIIDFGDAVYTQTINDLAIVLTYAIMDIPDPLAAALDIVKAYNKHYPLSEKELECLYTLVGIRLVISVTKSTIRKKEVGSSDYHTISEKSAWLLLKKWRSIHPHFALYSFRETCGYSAHPSYDQFKEWALTNKVSLSNVFPTLSFNKLTDIDMSVGSIFLGNASEYNDPALSEFKLQRLQRENPNSLLANGYLETRPFYSTEAFKSESNNGPQYRTVHLGTDFWIPTETPIHTPFDGVIVILHDNDFVKDYGPTIIIEHAFNQEKFYTLYGHLSRASLSRFKVGQHVKQGDLIANVGAFSENGNWPSHLHFQLMMDLMGNGENFPGVAFPSEESVWKSVCPNPMLLFLEELVPEKADLSEEKMKIFRKEHLGKGLSLSYSKPMHIVRGEGAYLIDSDGKKYLDTANNVNHVGHQHPEVVKAGQQQMALLNTNTRYLHENIISYADALLKKLPKELSVLHFVNSGSEANELALRMAKICTGQNDFLAIEVGYHGNTNAVMDVSSYKFDGKGGSGQPLSTHILPLPDPFRGRHPGENSGKEYASYAKKHIEHQKANGEGIAGFIGESMISCGGQIVPHADYFKEVYKHVRSAGGLCIADEVQTGFGRMGKTFWAFELYDVIPDIVTMGKPAGNGHPLAVVACTREVAEKFNTGMEYFNTFGGNPVSCAIGTSVLDVIEKEKLQQNALETGGYLKSELQSLRKEFPIIGDVRGEGLFLGFELNDANKNPLAEHASYLADRMKELGILMSTDGPDYNVLKIKPPMVFSKANASELIFRLKTVFTEDFMMQY